MKKLDVRIGQLFRLREDRKMKKSTEEFRWHGQSTDPCDIFKGKFNNELMKKVFEVCVLSTLTYGRQTWSISKRLLAKLSVYQTWNRM